MMAVVEQSGSASPGVKGGLRRLEGSLRPRLRAAWHWWIRSLVAWLPGRLRDLFGLAPQRLLLWRTGADYALGLWRGEARRTLAEHLPLPEPGSGDDPLAAVLTGRLAEVPRWLLLPASAVLRRRLVLPAGAGERLRDVLGFEIDRQTPFAAQDVHHDVRVVGRRGDDQIEAELVVIPKASLAAELAALGPLAATLAGVDVADASGEPLGVNLMAGVRQRRRDDPWRLRNLALLAAGLLALYLGLWQMLANRRAAAEAFQQQVDAQVRQARLASQQRRQLVDLVEGGAFLQAKRAATPSMVEVMDELAERLPDGTWLEKLSIEGDRILLIGLSGEASALVGRLQGSALWTDPALAGALQPDPRTRTDRFTLTATLASRATQAAASPAAEVPDATGSR